MKGFTLYCADDEFAAKGKWCFEVLEDGVDVIDPRGQIASSFVHQEAGERFTLPSFWHSIKKIGFTLDSGSTIWFSPGRIPVRCVTNYLDEALLRQGPGAIGALRKKGWINILIALAFLSAGVAGSILTHEFFDTIRTLNYFFAGMAVLGLGKLGGAMAAILRAGKLSRQRLHLEDE